MADLWKVLGSTSVQEDGADVMKLDLYRQAEAGEHRSGEVSLSKGGTAPAVALAVPALASGVVVQSDTSFFVEVDGERTNCHGLFLAGLSTRAAVSTIEVSQISAVTHKPCSYMVVGEI